MASCMRVICAQFRLILLPEDRSQLILVQIGSWSDLVGFALCLFANFIDLILALMISQPFLITRLQPPCLLESMML